MIIVENVLSISDKELLAGLMERIAKGKTPESNVVVFLAGRKDKERFRQRRIRLRRKRGR